jgi:hypothetical protein
MGKEIDGQQGHQIGQAQLNRETVAEFSSEINAVRTWVFNTLAAVTTMFLILNFLLQDFEEKNGSIYQRFLSIAVIVFRLVPSLW